MRLLEQFEATFSGTRYRHRSSTIGDRISRLVFEDLYNLHLNPTFNRRVDSCQGVVNTRNHVTGRRARRGDGTFGQRVASLPCVRVPHMNVAEGPVATIQFGVEVKILATAMIKQIDRVDGDLKKQVQFFRTQSENVITLGIVGVNHADQYTSYEGIREYRKPGETGPAPAVEAVEARRRLSLSAELAYSEFLFLPFIATNRVPYEFRWLNKKQTLNDYTAILQRLLNTYGSRFP